MARSRNDPEKSLPTIEEIELNAQVKSLSIINSTLSVSEVRPAANLKRINYNQKKDSDLSSFLYRNGEELVWGKRDTSLSEDV